MTGFGKVHGRRVFVTADDFSVRGGHADGGIQAKAPYGEVSLNRLSQSFSELICQTDPSQEGSRPISKSSLNKLSHSFLQTFQIRLLDGSSGGGSVALCTRSIYFP